MENGGKNFWRGESFSSGETQHARGVRL